MKFFLGIDVGIKGAIAILNEHGGIVQISDMPVTSVKVGSSTKNIVSPQALTDDLSILEGHEVHALVEKVASRPGQGLASMFGFGRSLGVVEGVLAGMRIPIEMVSPAQWTKAMRVNPGKDGSRQRAMELWPNDAGLFKRAKDDGRSDAALIALYLKERKQ